MPFKRQAECVLLLLDAVQTNSPLTLHLHHRYNETEGCVHQIQCAEVVMFYSCGAQVHLSQQQVGGIKVQNIFAELMEF